jgi:hypothetical protein
MESRLRRRWLLPVAALGAAAIACTAFASACSSSSGGSAADAMAPGDDGAIEDAGTDASGLDGTMSDAPSTDGTLPDATPADAALSDVSTPVDTGSDAVADAADGEAGATMTTQLLVPGTSFQVMGVTTDGHVVYNDRSAGAYYAKPLDGGAATTIYTSPGSMNTGYASVFGNVVFVWAWNSGTYIGTLTTWTPGMAQGATLTTSGLAYLYQTIWASDDSTHIAYLTSTTSDASQSSLYGAKADGTGATLLLANIDTNAAFSGQHPACFPRALFRGDYLFVSSCTVTDAGVTPTIQSFSISGGWAPAAVVPSWVHSLQYAILDRSPFTFSFEVDPDGGRIAAASTASGDGGLQVFPSDGGPGAALDPSYVLASAFSFTGSPTAPWSLFYNNDAGVLRQAYASNPAPQVLVDAGVNYLDALSNDGKWMLVSSTQNNDGYFTDVSLVSTQTPGVPVPVVTSTQYGSLPVTPSGWEYGGPRGFTVDSSYALATTNMTQNNAGAWIGSLRSMSVTTPNTTKLLTNGYMLRYQALRGTKVLVEDNFQDTDGGSQPTVDFDVVDPASSGGPVNITQGVQVQFNDYGVSADQTQVAYVIATGASPGIYVSTLP